MHVSAICGHFRSRRLHQKQTYSYPSQLDRLMNIDYWLRMINEVHISFSYIVDIIVYVHARRYFSTGSVSTILDGFKFETPIIWTVVCVGGDKNLS